MQKWAKQSGFTIVELLIVVVVIAILAAITIVAYNGIQNRARTSAVSSAASQAGRQLLTYAPVNGDTYPTEAQFQLSSFRLGTLKLPEDTPEATYDYYVSDDQKSFCLSVTNTNASPEIAYAMTQEGSEVPGRCVENLVANPSFEVDIAGSVVNGAASRTRESDGFTGNWHLTIKRTASGDSYGAINVGDTAGQSVIYTASFRARSASSVQSSGLSMIQELYGGYRALSTLIPNGATVSSNWTLYSSSFTTPSDLSSGGLRFVLRAGPAIGDSLQYDSIMLLRGDTNYTYGDGDSPNWSWSGAPHNSVSFGPSLPN